MNPTAQARLAVAGWIATLLAALTIHPLVRDLTWVAPVIIVTAIVVGTGAALRQLTSAWPVIAVAQALVLLITLTALFVRDAAVLGVLPGPEAVDAAGRLLSEGVQVTRQAAAPVPDAAGIILLVVSGLGLVGLCVDVIAVSLHRPAVAGLPLLAVYCVPAAVLPDGLNWLYFVVAALGFLVLVGADAGDRVRSWGRILGGRDAESATKSLGGPLAGARRIAVTCLCLAVAVPLLIPGLDEHAFVGGDGPGAGKKPGKINVVNPILTLRQNLQNRSTTPVLRYDTTVASPEPLRIVSDDYFDGVAWAPTTGTLSRSQRVQESLPPPPGLSAAVPTTRQSTKISVFGLNETYLPLPYPTYRVDIDGDWLFEKNSLNVVGDHVTTVNTSYTAYHYVVTPTAAQLQSAGPPPLDVRQTFTKLPDDLPEVIRKTARTVVGNADNDYAKAVRLQDWLRVKGGFTYSVVPSGSTGDDSSDNAVAAFLAGKKGYCVQFASAMAVMARSLGIPSRVAVGFLPGKKIGPQTYEIALVDAHAWPELYFSGVGWVRFEPTPAGRVANAPTYTLNPAGEPVGQPSVSASASAAPSASGGGVTQPNGRNRDALDNVTDPAPKPLLTRIWEGIPWRVIAILGGALLVLLLPLVTSRVGRRARWRRAAAATEPQVRAEAAWDDLRLRLTDLGVRWAASWTPRALQRRVADDHGLGGSERAALGRLVTDLEGARYAPPGGVPIREASEMRADVDLVVASVSQELLPALRRRARWFPASGVETLSRAGSRVDAAAGEAGRRAAELGADVRRTISSGRR